MEDRKERDFASGCGVRLLEDESERLGCDVWEVFSWETGRVYRAFGSLDEFAGRYERGEVR